MYREFYNLKEDPFSLTPDPQFVYMAPQHREALSGLIYSALTRPGLTVLAGEVGTGKTTLLYTLMELLEKRKFTTAICTNPTMRREEFYDYILTDLGVQCSSTLKSQQLFALQEALLKNQQEGRPPLLIVDEGQRLSAELLEEIRLLTNLETPRRKLLQIIMAGQPELMDTIRRPEFRQLKQRVSYFCQLEPLRAEEVCEYINHRMKQAGLPHQEVFSPPVMHVIHEYSKGIPRVINTLCDNALQAGFALQSRRITLAIVREAAKSLDMLPAPQRGSPPADAPPPAKNPFVTKSPLEHPAKANGSSPAGESLGIANPFPEPVPLSNYEAKPKSFGFLGRLVGRRG